MTEGTVKVGDVVAWDAVPDGALVREGDNTFSVRCGDKGHIVHFQGCWWGACPGRGLRGEHDERVTVIALGLTGSESADDLRRIAEAFEVRELPAAEAASNVANDAFKKFATHDFEYFFGPAPLQSK